MPDKWTIVFVFHDVNIKPTNCVNMKILNCVDVVPKQENFVVTMINVKHHTSRITKIFWAIQ